MQQTLTKKSTGQVAANRLFHRILVYCLLCLMVLITKVVSGQRIENVIVGQQNNTVIINYDLIGLDSGQSANILLFLSNDSGLTWESIKDSVNGDIGQGIMNGNRKRIVWQVLKVRDQLIGNQICFEVRAMLGVKKQITIAGIDFTYVQGGTFLMGCTQEQVKDCGNNEKPAHQVTVDDYYICTSEITLRQWRTIMSRNPPEYDIIGCNPCPVVSVCWTDTQDFISKLNALTGNTLRLPTEAEWEYAARGGHEGSNTKYSGSNTIDDVAWYAGNCEIPLSVGMKAPNILGLSDMSGNAWEWCNDWYGEYISTAQLNPRGPATGKYRILRGGYWGSSPSSCRTSSRNYDQPTKRKYGYGFRLVLPISFN